jgi:hypothetical protein
VPPQQVTTTTSVPPQQVTTTTSVPPQVTTTLSVPPQQVTTTTSVPPQVTTTLSVPPQQVTTTTSVSPLVTAAISASAVVTAQPLTIAQVVTNSKITSGNKRPRANVERVDKVTFVNSSDLSNLERTVYNSVAFAGDIDQCEFIALNCPSGVVGHQLDNLCNIATTYTAERELCRKQLYNSLMLEIQVLFNRCANEQFEIKYEDWAHCFNIIFTKIIGGKLQTCSRYTRGATVVTQFRNNSNSSHQQDIAPLTTYMKVIKQEAATDEKEIMKILNMVIKDCCTASNNLTSNNCLELVCREDYSSIYQQSTVEENFQQYLCEKMNSNSSYGFSFQQLMLATEPHAILMSTISNVYNADKLTVCSFHFQHLFF